jgi:2-oxoglutarate ferredoxin oxidoreductase subunit alpha
LTEHLAELTEKSLVILNAANFDQSKYPDLKAKVFAIPMTKIARENSGKIMSANIAALGVSAALFAMDLKILGEVIRDEFGDKNREIIQKNLLVLKKAAEMTEALIAQGELNILQDIDAKEDKQLLLTGNEAIGLGAITAGIQFYSAYPMTPSTGLLHYLASKQEDYPLVVKHAEDEIGAINHALGASFAGVRSMTGSSGGGFALMIEALSFAGVAEIPIVISEAMRQGPATGLPTWTSQGDLNFVLNAGHGDFLRVVLTPGNVEEHFKLSQKAFELAEKFQIPVLILSDKYILESHQTMAMPNLDAKNKRYSILANGKLGDVGVKAESYLRYQDTENGISERSIPGQENALQLTNSYDHDQYGFATEDAVETKKAADKRLKKLSSLMKEIPEAVYFGNKQAKTVLVSFGSTTNVLKEVLQADSSLGLVHLPVVAPFPKDSFEKLLADREKVYVLEGNLGAQLASLIRKETGVRDFTSVLRYDGRPFYAADILEFLQTGKINQQYKVIE